LLPTVYSFDEPLLLLYHFIEDTFLKVQLKGRITIGKKYLKKNIYICFPNNKKTEWYLVPHDKLVQELEKHNMWINSSSWIKGGNYSSISISAKIQNFVNQFKL